ncbi:MAG: HAD hydrolase family protein [Anaeromassilibacillus sp.]
MFFQRIEDLRIDHDKTQQEIADVLSCKREVYRVTKDPETGLAVPVATYYHVSSRLYSGIKRSKGGAYGRKFLFDIDGTLLSSKNERHLFVQPSTWKALEQLKQNGHIVAISSGRPERFIHKYFPGIFSNYVAMNGAHVVVDGKTVFEEFFSPTEVREFMQYFDQYGCWYNFVGNSRGWARHVPPEQIEPLNESYGMPGYLQTEWEPEDVHASIIDFVFRDDAHYEQCKPAFQEPMVLNKHPGSLAADLSFKGKDKSRGVKMFLQQAGTSEDA